MQTVLKTNKIIVNLPSNKTGVDIINALISLLTTRGMQGKKIYYEVVQTLRNRLVNGSHGVYLKPETHSIFPSIHKGLISESMLAPKKPISMNGKIAIIKSCLFIKYQTNELYFVIEPVNSECTNDKVTFIITAQLPKKGQHSELFPVQLEELGDCVVKDFLNGFLREISRK